MLARALAVSWFNLSFAEDGKLGTINWSVLHAPFRRVWGWKYPVFFISCFQILPEMKKIIWNGQREIGTSDPMPRCRNRLNVIRNFLKSLFPFKQTFCIYFFFSLWLPDIQTSIKSDMCLINQLDETGECHVRQTHTDQNLISSLKVSHQRNFDLHLVSLSRDLTPNRCP